MKFKRSTASLNFTATEKYILLNIIYNYKDILEDKKGDAQTLKTKQETWKKIENCFNALSDHNIYRTARSLKKFYEHKKRELQVAEERSDMLKVGGEPLMVKDESWKEFFSELANNNFVTDEPDLFEEVIIEEVVCSNGNQVNSGNTGEEIVNMQSLDPDWEDNKPANLRKSIKGKSRETVKLTKRNSRKRPLAIASLTTQDISKKYVDLTKIKSEVANLQRDMLTDERRRRTLEAILREESLKLDIEIKKKQLEILSGMAKRHAA